MFVYVYMCVCVISKVDVCCCYPDCAMSYMYIHVHIMCSRTIPEAIWYANEMRFTGSRSPRLAYGLSLS